MQAVHNEFAKNQQSDSWRLYQILKANANPAHPLARFGSGIVELL